LAGVDQLAKHDPEVAAGEGGFHRLSCLLLHRDHHRLTGFAALDRSPSLLGLRQAGHQLLYRLETLVGAAMGVGAPADRQRLGWQAGQGIGLLQQWIEINWVARQQEGIHCVYHLAQPAAFAHRQAQLVEPIDKLVQLASIAHHGAVQGALDLAGQQAKQGTAASRP